MRGYWVWVGNMHQHVRVGRVYGFNASRPVDVWVAEHVSSFLTLISEGVLSWTWDEGILHRDLSHTADNLAGLPLSSNHIAT